MSLSQSSLFESAPYLAELARTHQGWLDTALVEPNQALAAELSALRQAGETMHEEGEIAQALRLAKARIALLSAVAETVGQWSTAQSTAALSDLADAALEASLDVLFRRAQAKGSLWPGPEEARAARGGLALFALGKHGGRELNYSSDIDIVAFFDPDLDVLADPGEATRFYSRLVQRLVSLMQDRIGGAYVFRTDLRLRPDPGSTPVALSVGAALAYYESRGQNWERAAWIKARPCAGDLSVGEAFLKELAPYVWRRHLDFATIADIQAMKRQINIAKSVGEARVLGHNVKLGRGGIREIEFFAQTQQLIAGGRDVALRVRPTTEALTALASAGWITNDAATALKEAYWFLRAVENRLQMRNDEQTHMLPEDAEGIGTIASMMAFPSREAFEEAYRAALATVSGYYAQLFSEGESLGTGEGDLVFTGSDDDPGTLQTLAAMGFADPKTVSATVRKWHYGGYLATRAAASRAHLTELLPSLLRTFVESGASDAALKRFDDFLARLPAGVQLFSLLRRNDSLRTLLVRFLASAPRMAEAVIHRAHVMDALIDPAYADEISRPAALVRRVDGFLAEARTYEDLIDRARIIGGEQKFLLCASLLSGTLTGARAGELFTALAETLLGRLFTAVQGEFAKRHGVVPGAQAALLGFGKMASREMTVTSDLDFVLLYHAQGTDESDGDRPLAASHYFTRLTQRLVAALGAPTAEGVLYQADMRLRPSGNAGPLATSFAGFLTYQKQNAWTWEHLALSRARVIAADPGFKERIEAGIAEVLSRPRDVPKTIGDVVSMRALIAKERPPRHSFDLKLVPGGLVDLEFIAQSAQLVAYQRLERPQAPVNLVLARMGEVGLLPEGERLGEIHRLYSDILQIMSAALLQPLKEEGWAGAFRDLLTGLVNYPDFQRLTSDLADMQQTVMAASKDWYSRAANLS